MVVEKRQERKPKERCMQTYTESDKKLNGAEKQKK